MTSQIPRTTRLSTRRATNSSLKKDPEQNIEQLNMSTRNSSRLRRQQIQVTLSRRASTPASSTDRAARQISTENNSRFSRGRSNPPQENSNTSRNQNKSILNNSNDVRARLRPRLNSTYPTRAATHFQNITNQLPVAFFNIDSSDSEVEEVPDKVQVIDLSNDEIQAKETQQPAMIRGHETICPICFGKAREHQPVSTPCGHIYCKSCITKSLQSRAQQKCPMCKKILPARNPFHLVYL